MHSQDVPLGCAFWEGAVGEDLQASVPSQSPRLAALIGCLLSEWSGRAQGSLAWAAQDSPPPPRPRRGLGRMGMGLESSLLGGTKEGLPTPLHPMIVQ